VQDNARPGSREVSFSPGDFERTACARVAITRGSSSSTRLLRSEPKGPETGTGHAPAGTCGRRFGFVHRQMYWVGCVYLAVRSIRVGAADRGVHFVRGDLGAFPGHDLGSNREDRLGDRGRADSMSQY
jgi:hypothetical protein